MKKNNSENRQITITPWTFYGNDKFQDEDTTTVQKRQIPKVKEKNSNPQKQKTTTQFSQKSNLKKKHKNTNSNNKITKSVSCNNKNTKNNHKQTTKVTRDDIVLNKNDDDLVAATQDNPQTTSAAVAIQSVRKEKCQSVTKQQSTSGIQLTSVSESIIVPKIKKSTTFGNQNDHLSNPQPKTRNLKVITCNKNSKLSKQRKDNQIVGFIKKKQKDTNNNNNNFISNKNVINCTSSSNKFNAPVSNKFNEPVSNKLNNKVGDVDNYNSFRLPLSKLSIDQKQTQQKEEYKSQKQQQKNLKGLKQQLHDIILQKHMKHNKKQINSQKQEKTKQQQKEKQQEKEKEKSQIHTVVQKQQKQQNHSQNDNNDEYQHKKLLLNKIFSSINKGQHSQHSDQYKQNLMLPPMKMSNQESGTNMYSKQKSIKKYYQNLLTYLQKSTSAQKDAQDEALSQRASELTQLTNRQHNQKKVRKGKDSLNGDLKFAEMSPSLCVTQFNRINSQQIKSKKSQISGLQSCMSLHNKKYQHIYQTEVKNNINENINRNINHNHNYNQHTNQNKNIKNNNILFKLPKLPRLQKQHQNSDQINSYHNRNSHQQPLTKRSKNSIKIKSHRSVLFTKDSSSFSNNTNMDITSGQRTGNGKGQGQGTVFISNDNHNLVPCVQFDDSKMRKKTQENKQQQQQSNYCYENNFKIKIKGQRLISPEEQKRNRHYTRTHHEGQDSARTVLQFCQVVADKKKVYTKESDFEKRKENYSTHRNQKLLQPSFSVDRQQDHIHTDVSQCNNDQIRKIKNVQPKTSRKGEQLSPKKKLLSMLLRYQNNDNITDKHTETKHRSIGKHYFYCNNQNNDKNTIKQQ